MYAERFRKMDTNKVIGCLDNINHLIQHSEYIDDDDIYLAMGCSDIACSDCIFADHNNIYDACCGDEKSNLPIPFASQNAVEDIQKYLNNLIMEIKPYDEVDI